LAPHPRRVFVAVSKFKSRVNAMSDGRQPHCPLTESAWLHANIEPGHRHCTNYAICSRLLLS